MNNKTKNGDLPAFSKAAFYHPDGGSDSPNDGVTKREYFAAMAMQGLLVNYIDNGMYGNSTDYPMVSEQSVRMADELLKQLDNEQD